MDLLPPIAAFYNNDAVKSILRDEMTRAKLASVKYGSAKGWLSYNSR